MALPQAQHFGDLSAHVANIEAILGVGRPGSALPGDIPAESNKFEGTASFSHCLLSLAAASAVERGKHSWMHLSEEL